MHTMEKDVSEMVEVTMPIPERIEGEGVCAGGIHGGCSSEVMIDRAKRVKDFQKRLDYRESIPCDRCGNCLEMRGFTKRHTEYVIALYCMVAEMEVSPFHTCNYARRSRRNRKKVVYYMENAPGGFKVEAERMKAEVPYVVPGSGKRLEPTIPREGYVGGSGYYRRADGDSVKGGEGRIPKGLMN